MSDNNTGTRVIIGCSSLINIALAVTALYYGVENLDNVCSDSFIHLAVWMIVHGAFLLFMVLGGCITMCVPFGAIVYAIVAMFYGLFSLIWALVGSVILWRDSTNCHDISPAFYIASFVVVVFALVGAFCNCCCGGTVVKGSQSNA